MNWSGGNLFPPIFGLKIPVVKARVPKQNCLVGKAVSHRNCARKAQKAGRKKPTMCVRRVSMCWIPKSGANRLSRKKKKKKKWTVVIANVFVLNEKLYWYIFHCCAHFGNCTSTFLRVGPFFSKYVGPFSELYRYTFPSAPFFSGLYPYILPSAPIFVTVLIHFSARAQMEVFLQSGRQQKAVPILRYWLKVNEYCYRRLHHSSLLERMCQA